MGLLEAAFVPILVSLAHLVLVLLWSIFYFNKSLIITPMSVFISQLFGLDDTSDEKSFIYVTLFLLFLIWYITFFAYSSASAYVNKQMESPENNNNYPRQQSNRIRPGLPARLYACHENDFEQLVTFTIALALALYTKQSAQFLNQVCIMFLTFRLVYRIWYILNIGLLRTITFGHGIMCTIILFLSSIYGYNNVISFIQNKLPKFVFFE